jgi:hypothetical protein
MNAAGRGLILTAMILGGCRTAHDVAVASYNVATAPVKLVRRAIDGPPPTTSTTTTTTTIASDVTTPGAPVPPSAATESVAPREGRSSASVVPRVTQRETAGTKPKPASSPRGAPAPPEFPTAKPVADKPGYVYSPSDPGKYVDVSGYARGSKVKDPYSGKIFLVP